MNLHWNPEEDTVTRCEFARDRSATSDIHEQVVPRPIKVCFLIDELACAGTETQLLALIRNLDRRQVTPYLCLLRGETSQSRALEPTDCRVIRLGVGSLRNPLTLLKMWNLIRFLRREQMDVLQVYFPDSTYLGVPAGWLAGVPSIIRTRNNVGHWLTPVHRWLGRVMNLFTTLTIANCQAARQVLLTTEKPPPHRVVVIENGVDLGHFAAIPSLDSLSPGPFRRVGMVANLRVVKGVDIFLEAADRLSRTHPHVTFRVAGDGEEKDVLQHQIKARGLNGSFHLLGSVNDIPAFLSELEIAVLSSRAEGMSNALLEYMAAGRAIVATQVGANGNLIKNESNGLLIPAEDPQLLAEAIGRLLQNRSLAATLGNNAREYVTQYFTREAMVRRFETLYLHIHNNRQLGAPGSRCSTKSSGGMQRFFQRTLDGVKS